MRNSTMSAYRRTASACACTSPSVSGTARRGRPPSSSAPNFSMARVWREAPGSANRRLPAWTWRPGAATVRRMQTESAASALPGRRAFWIGLLAIVALAAVVRIAGLRDLPPGLFCDEAGNGYNSYLLLTTGHDENHELLPLYVWSFGVSYKNPVFIYAATLPIALFGLSEFSVRLTAALFGIAAVVGIGVLAAACSGWQAG